MIELHTEIPPTINSYYVKTRNGIFISQKGKEFRKKVIEESIIQSCRGICLTNRIHLSLFFFFPDHRRRDIDNYVKPLLDAITHAEIWKDDSQVDIINIYRANPRTPSSSKTIIYIKEMSHPPFITESIANEIAISQS